MPSPSPNIKTAFVSKNFCIGSYMILRKKSIFTLISHQLSQFCLSRHYCRIKLLDISGYQSKQWHHEFDTPYQGPF